MDDIWAAIDDLAKQSREAVEKERRETEARWETERKKAEKERRETQERLEKERREAEARRERECGDAQNRRKETEERLERERREAEALREQEAQDVQEYGNGEYKEPNAKPIGGRGLFRKARKEEWTIGRHDARRAEMAERVLVPGLVEKFAKYGCLFTKLNLNTSIRDLKNGIVMDFDAMLEDGNCVMAVEAVEKLTRDDIADFIERLRTLRKYYALRNDARTLYGAVASTAIDETVKTFSRQQGLYTIEPSGKNVTVTPPLVKQTAF
jgi:hypothetical protein